MDSLKSVLLVEVSVTFNALEAVGYTDADILVQCRDRGEHT
jgi:hypothetical protein